MTKFGKYGCAHAEGAMRRQNSNAAIYVDSSNHFCVLYRETMITDNSAAFGQSFARRRVFYERRPRAYGLYSTARGVVLGCAVWTKKNDFTVQCEDN